MRKTLTFLAATTAITAGIGLPAWSALRADTPAHSVSTARTSEAMLILVSGDDEDDDDDNATRSREHEDDDDCEDDDGNTPCTGLANPAPAGTTAPPQNGLFGDGPPPQVQLK